MAAAIASPSKCLFSKRASVRAAGRRDDCSQAQQNRLHIKREQRVMRIVMIGSGYVGLVSGACFADFGPHVTCVDKDATKIGRLRAGGIPISEHGLDGRGPRTPQAGTLPFTTQLSDPPA